MEDYMFSVPIIVSKLIMPQNSIFFLNSPRISKLCENILKTRVVEITAPLGYGKTSLAAAALSRCTAGSRICWYRLDEQDINMTLFYSHLIETLFPSNLPSYSQFRQKFDEFGDAEAQSAFINQLICNSLYETPGKQNRTRTYLVLDDYHTVAGSKEIQSAIRWLVDNLPNSFSIIITSRVESGLITEKQKFENDTLKIIIMS
jgi:ATP/maltotriose-dependent transcriptional regulator MalT